MAKKITDGLSNSFDSYYNSLGASDNSTNDFDSYYNSLGASKNSNSEFDNYYHSLPTASNQSDEYSAAPKQTAKNTWSLGASIRNVDSALGQFVTPEMHRANEQQKQLEAQIPQTAPMQPNPQAQRDFMRRAAGIGSGIASVGDTIANLPRYGINKVNEALNTGVEMPYTHFQDDFNTLPGVRDLRQDAPEYFDTYADTAATVLPLPGRAGEALKDTAWINQTVGRRIADAALTNGLIGGAGTINDKLQHGQDPSIWDAAQGFAGGAALGGGLHGFGEGVARVGQAAQQGFRDLLSGLTQSKGVNTSRQIQMPLKTPQSGISSLDESLLDPEDLEAYRLMGNTPEVVPNTPPQKRMQTGDDVLDYVNKLRNGDPKISLIKTLVSDAAKNVPGQGRIGRAPDRGRDYLDYSRAQAMPEDLRFPRYLDLSQAPKSMGDLASGLTKVAGGDSSKVLTGGISRDVYHVAKIKNATPDTIEQILKDAIAEAPKGTTASHRKQYTKKIDKAFSEWAAVQRGEKPKLDPLEGLKGKAQKDVDIQPEPVAEVQAPVKPLTSADYKPIKYLDDEQLRDLEVREAALYPNARRDVFLSGMIDGHKRIEKISPRQLTDNEIDEALDSFERINRQKFNKSTDRASARQDMQTLIEEKMRREMRKALNVQQDWAGGVPDVRHMTEEALIGVIDKGSNAAQEEAARELIARRQAPLQGAVRYGLPRDNAGKQLVGRERIQNAMHIDDYPASVIGPQDKALLQEYATRKLMKDAAEHRLEQASEQIYQAMGDGVNPVQVGRLQVNPPKMEARLTREGQAAKDSARADFADFVSELKGSNARATAHVDASEYTPPLQLPNDMPSLEAALAQLKTEAAQAVKAYDSLKGQVAEAVNRADTNVKRLDNLDRFSATVPVQLADGKIINVNVERVNMRMEKEFAQEAFEKAKRKDPQLQPEVFFANWELARAKATGVAPRPTAQVIADSAKNLDNYKSALAAIEAQHGYQKRVPGSVVRLAKTLPAFATGVSAAVEGAGQAQAADGSETQAQPNAMPVTAALATLTAAGIGAGVIRKYGMAAIKDMIGSKLGMVANLYRDTLDHVGILDKALGLDVADGLARKVWKRQAEAIRAGFGVHFDSDDQRAVALGLLKDKLVTPVQALQGLQGTIFADLTSEQRKAIVGAYLQMKALKTEVANYRKALDAAIAAGKIDKKKIKASLYALDFLQDQLSPRSRDGNEIGDWFKARTANAMDFLFGGFNVKFFALNLSDSFIAGGSKVGPLRIAKAWQLMATDAEMQALMKDSGLVGSFRALRQDQTANANRTNLSPSLKDKDLNSDRVNANRVFLASLLEHFDDDVDKVKALLQGRLSDDEAIDAFIHAIDTGSRTLGVDPFRLNTDVISRWSQSPVLGLFVRQPARIARLAYRYIADRQPGKLSTLLLFTAAVGGNAAVPEDVKATWQYMDPASYFALSKALDEIDVYRRLTGFSASDKVGLAVAFPVLSQVSPIIETVIKAPEKAERTIEAIKAVSEMPINEWGKTGSIVIEGQKTKAIKAITGLYSDFAMVFASRLPGGLPAAWVVRGARAAEQMREGSMPVYNFEKFGDKPFAKTSSMPLDAMRYGSATPIVHTLLPGQPAEIQDQHLYELEKKKRSKAGQAVKPNQQEYADLLAGLRRRN